MPNNPNVDLTPVLRKLEEVNRNILNNPIVTAGLVTAPLLQRINKIPQETASKLPTPNCRFTTVPIYDAANKVNGHTSALDIIQTGLIVNQTGIMNTVNTKLGPELPGGISTFLDKFFVKFNKFLEWMHVDRILNVLTWVNTTHNAYMLSNNLSQTLFSIIDTGLNTILKIFFRDVENQVDINTGQFFGGLVDLFAKNVFGVETWEGMKETWRKYNRIYQAATNLLNGIRQLYDSLKEVVEWIAENLGKIGNALRSFGVLPEFAFPRMPEKVNAQNRWMNRLQNLEEAASSLAQVTSSVEEVVDSVNELKTNSDEFKKSIKEALPQERVDNDPVKLREEAKKLALLGMPQPTIEQYIKGEIPGNDSP